MERFMHVLFLIFSPFLFFAQDTFLFSSDRNGNSDIYLFNRENESLFQITNSSDEEWGPVWIENQKISFLRQSGNQVEIVVRDLLSDLEYTFPQPESCILDDKNIVYNHSGTTGIYVCNNEIYKRNMGNNEDEKIDISISGSSNYLEWVDTTHFLFTNNSTGSNCVYMYDLNTGGLENLTPGTSNDERGSLSPDGRFLAYSSDQFEKNNQDIVIKDLITSKVINISNNKGFDLIARWGNDSNSLYYGSNKEGNWEIYLYHLDTQKTVNLTKNKAFDGDPRISPLQKPKY